MKGYKVFDPGFICRDYDFKVDGIAIGTTHVFDGEPVLCESGFHFCTELQDCFNYYIIKKNMVVCEVEAEGCTDAKDGCSKRSCKKLTIVRQLTLEEVIPFITDSHFAYCWALKFGNQDIMIDRITDPAIAHWWVSEFGNYDVMFERFPVLKEILS